MKIIAVQQLAIPDVQAIRFQRFTDMRGYFTESYRRGDFDSNPQVPFLANLQFEQSNESYSRPGVIRGLHFQWNPFMGKLVRTLFGHVIDLVLDIRRGSPTYGKAIAHDMPGKPDQDWGEWVWVPPGFAHGNVFMEPTMIEYFCTGQYSPGCEAGICPLSPDIDWSLCDPALKSVLDSVAGTAIITDKDRLSPNLTAWTKDKRSENFINGRC